MKTGFSKEKKTFPERAAALAGRTAAALKRDWQLWILVLPLLVWLYFYAFRPLSGIAIAFLDYSPFKGIEGSDFIGLENFKNLMFGASSELFWRAFKNTVLISMYGLVFSFPVPIIIALMFHELRGNKRRKMLQTVTYAPHFISEVVVCSLVVTMLSMNTGLFNVILEKIFTFFGAEYEQIHFMAESKFFRTIYTLSGIWKEAGFSSIVFFASLCGIPVELYEAAKVDGAGRFRQIWSISIPGILPTIMIMLIIRVGNILNVGYEKVLLLYNPGIYDTADILSTFTYRMGIANNPDYGLSTAASLVNSVVGFALVVLANRISKKFSETSLW